MVTRRDFLRGCAAVLLGSRAVGPAARGAAPELDPRSIPKYVTPLPIPPVMPAAPGEDPGTYVIAVRRFRQRMLPPGYPVTTVFGYGAPHRPETFATPAWTIEARADRPVQVTWVNQLVGRDGRHLPHLLSVDPTLHWANPPGGVAHRDHRPSFTSTPGPYRGPVPIVTHLHGGHSPDDSDGHPEAWFLPAARTVPAGYAAEGSRYAEFAEAFAERTGVTWRPGSAVYRYRNDQAAATLWYHDHALGITRLNVYAGLAGFYLIRGGPADLPQGVLPWPAPQAGDPPGLRYHEIPLAVQDRSFTADGALHYPDRRDAGGATGAYLPHGDVPPIWVPEFFGTTMLVNGVTWPVLDVEPRRYRFRLLNGCNSRTLILSIAASPAARPVRAALPLWCVGGDGGFLPSPVELERLTLAPAERADVVVDFTGVREGTELYLVNEGPDVPYRGDGSDRPADPATTGQVMKFVVRALTGRDTSVPPGRLELPSPAPLGEAVRTRRLALLERESATPEVGPVAALLGVEGARPVPYGWHDPVTENPAVGDVEVWEFHNHTVDAHPMHIHEVMFEVVGREPFRGPARGPYPWERGRKDTVIAPPQQVTRVKARFDLAGRYVWHCHILEHEDNEMMRPYRIGP